MPPIVRRQVARDEHPKALVSQPLGRALEQDAVLERPARVRDGAEPAALGDERARPRGRGSQGAVEAGGRDAAA